MLTVSCMLTVSKYRTEINYCEKSHSLISLLSNVKVSNRMINSFNFSGMVCFYEQSLKFQWRWLTFLTSIMDSSFNELD